MKGMKKTQQGSGILSWLFLLLFLGLTLSLTAKVVPLYLSDHAVAEVISSLSNHQDSATATVSEVRSWINKGLQLNSVELSADEVEVVRGYSAVAVQVNYERRIHLFFNIDLILTFEHNWKSGT